MNIVFVAPRYHTNQIPIVRGLVEKGCHVRFYVYYTGFTEDHIDVIPKIIKRSWLSKIACGILKAKYSSGIAETKSIRWYMPSLWYIIKEFKKNKPDLVILRDRSKSSAVVYLACKLLRIKNVILYNQSHASLPPQKSFKNLFFPKVRYSPTDVAYDTSLENQDPHSYFVPFVYSTKSNVQKAIPDTNCIKILEVGKFRPYKNHYLIVDAVANLSKEHIIELTIVGQADSDEEKQYLEQLQDYVKELNLVNTVRILSNIPYSKMDELYAQNDMLVLCSHNEVAGMVILEAMANGLCTISPDNNGTACYVTKSNGGATYLHSDLQSLISVLTPFLKDTNKMFEAGQEGKQYIETQCNFETYWKNLTNLCRKEFKHVQIQ